MHTFEVDQSSLVTDWYFFILQEMQSLIIRDTDGLIIQWETDRDLHIHYEPFVPFHLINEIPVTKWRTLQTAHAF